MSGRIIPAISEERAGISKNWAIAHVLAFDSWPQNCHGAGGCVILLADVSWKAYTEAQGLVEVDLLAILNLLFSPSSWLTLCDLIEYSPPGSCVHEISQARILEWVAISFCRGSSQTSDWTHISCCFCIAGRFFTSGQSLCHSFIDCALPPFLLFQYGWESCILQTGISKFQFQDQCLHENDSTIGLKIRRVWLPRQRWPHFNHFVYALQE